jgi:hypothetical protein
MPAVRRADPYRSPRRDSPAQAKVTQGYIAQLEAGTRQRLSLEVADRLARELEGQSGRDPVWVLA